MNDILAHLLGPLLLLGYTKLLGWSICGSARRSAGLAARWGLWKALQIAQHNSVYVIRGSSVLGQPCHCL